MARKSKPTNPRADEVTAEHVLHQLSLLDDIERLRFWSTVFRDKNSVPSRQIQEVEAELRRIRGEREHEKGKNFLWQRIGQGFLDSLAKARFTKRDAEIVRLRDEPDSDGNQRTFGEVHLDIVAVEEWAKDQNDKPLTVKAVEAAYKRAKRNGQPPRTKSDTGPGRTGVAYKHKITRVVDRDHLFPGRP